MPQTGSVAWVQAASFSKADFDVGAKNFSKLRIIVFEVVNRMMSAVSTVALAWQMHCGVGGLHDVRRCAAASQQLNLIVQLGILASQGSINWALRKSNSMSEWTDGSLVTTLVFEWFNFRPSYSAACSKCLTSGETHQ